MNNDTQNDTPRRCQLDDCDAPATWRGIHQHTAVYTCDTCRDEVDMTDVCRLPQPDGVEVVS